MNKKELLKQDRRLFIAEAELKFEISKRGDSIAKRQGYKSLTGMDAVVRFLVDKHHWFPEQVLRLSTEELILLLD